MKKLILLSSLHFLLFFSTVSAQEPAIPVAIDFKSISFEAAKALAQQTGKAIFMDVYAVWCIPCKQFEKTVFTDKEVGNKFNAWFVNLKIDAEKEEGKKIAKLYRVGGYPTGIFINSDGILLTKFEGVLPKANFISYGENALRMMDDPHGYENAVALYTAKSKDLSTVRNLIKKSILSGNQIPSTAMDYYFGVCSNKIFLADTADLKKWVLSTPAVISGKETYVYFLKNTSFIKKYLALDDNFLKSFFYNSLQTSVQHAAAQKQVNELTKVLKLNAELPVNLRQVDNIDYELDYYLEVKDFVNYISKMNNYCHSTFDIIEEQKFTEKEKTEMAAHINNFGWNYLLYAENKNDLAYAETLMQKCVTLDSMFAAWYDTYSGIIYKQGNSTRAIEIENKAVLLSQKNAAEQNIYLNKIERMKRGEKIWLPEQF